MQAPTRGRIRRRQPRPVQPSGPRAPECGTTRLRAPAGHAYRVCGRRGHRVTSPSAPAGRGRAGNLPAHGGHEAWREMRGLQVRGGREGGASPAAPLEGSWNLRTTAWHGHPRMPGFARRTAARSLPRAPLTCGTIAPGPRNPGTPEQPARRRPRDRGDSFAPQCRPGQSAPHSPGSARRCPGRAVAASSADDPGQGRPEAREADLPRRPGSRGSLGAGRR